MRRSIVIFITFILLLNFTGCVGPFRKPVENAGKISKPVSSDNTEYVFNNGDCAFQGDRIYFCNSYDEGLLYSVKTDGSDMRKLNDVYTQWFYVTSNLIYYKDDRGRIWVMNIDGNDRKKLNDDKSENINVVGDRIYYSNVDDGFKPYSINADGSDRKKISDDVLLFMNVYGDRIYYSGKSNSGEYNGIYSVNLDGGQKTKLSIDKSNKILVKEDWIYYVNQDDDNKLYAMRTDGSDRHILIDVYTPIMNVVSDRIYYKSGDDWKFYSAKIDGSEKQLLSDDNVNWFAIGKDSIYYSITGAKIYSMNLDGSNKKLLAELDSDFYESVTYEISARLHEKMPEYRFVAKGLVNKTGIGIMNYGYVMGLEVYDENNKIILSEDFSEKYDDIVTGYPVYNEMMDTMGLHVVDVNFDGYKDVIILNHFGGAHGNTWYDCWLWDSATSDFVASESFSDICNPAIDHDNKCIYSAGGSGAAYWGGQIYKFIDGEFVLTNDLYTDWDGLVEKELVNGKMEIVREVEFGGDEQIIEKEKEYYNNHEMWQLSNPRWYWGGGHHADKWLE